MSNFMLKHFIYNLQTVSLSQECTDYSEVTALSSTFLVVSAAKMNKFFSQAIKYKTHSVILVQARVQFSTINNKVSVFS